MKTYINNYFFHRYKFDNEDTILINTNFKLNVLFYLMLFVYIFHYFCF